MKRKEQCCAPVSGRPIQYRASESESGRCQRSGKYLIAGKWFCMAHAAIWAEHYRILEKIRAIPSR